MRGLRSTECAAYAGGAFLCAALWLPATRCAARENGLATDGCTGCHTGGSATAVTITPSTTTIQPGQTIRLTVAIEAVNGDVGGLYFKATPGVGRLATVGGQSTKLSGSSGLTHSTPKASDGSFVTFLVDWTAPAEPGGVEFNAYAISADGNRRSTGDGAGAAFVSLSFGCAGTRYFPDRDGDGSGSLGSDYRMACAQPMYFAPNADDCDDNDERIYPGATELCNGRDDDCDQAVDEGLGIRTYCEDRDGDGHGVRSINTTTGCAPGRGFGLCDDDCDDTDATVYPGAPELCNQRDDNCDGRIDDDARVSCGIGWCRSFSESCVSDLCTPGQPRVEECNAFDDDCDGVADNGSDLCGAGRVCVNGSCLREGASDAGVTPTTPEAGVFEDAATPGTSTSGEGSGCRAAPHARGTAFPWWVALALAALSRARPRTRG